MEQFDANLNFETQLRQQGFNVIAGVDEVGRGPLAGPVTAAAVILGPQIPSGLADSKKLSAKRRAALEPEIKELSRWAVAHATVAEIDELNILHASLLAMRRAIIALGPDVQAALIDGNRAPKDLGIEAQAVVKGDARSLSIAAASILAKEERDRIMRRLDQDYPHYGWAQNAGYPTKVHLAGLQTHGITPHHRCSFKPVHNILCLSEK